MNHIHRRYAFLITINLAAAILCTISFITSFGSAVSWLGGALSVMNYLLIWFNFGQMNMMLERNGHDPVTMKSVKFSPAVSAFLQKYLYK